MTLRCCYTGVARSGSTRFDGYACGGCKWARPATTCPFGVFTCGGKAVPGEIHGIFTPKGSGGYNVACYRWQGVRSTSCCVPWPIFACVCCKESWKQTNTIDSWVLIFFRLVFLWLEFWRMDSVKVIFGWVGFHFCSAIVRKGLLLCVFPSISRFCESCETQLTSMEGCFLKLAECQHLLDTSTEVSPEFLVKLKFWTLQVWINKLQLIGSFNHLQAAPKDQGRKGSCPNAATCQIVEFFSFLSPKKIKINFLSWQL